VTFGRTQVPDDRVDQLTEVFSPKKTVYAEITFMDVGGGGRYDTGAFPPDVVQNMRNADVLVHVVRAFDNPMVGGDIDVAGDESKFTDELLLLDLEVLERRRDRMKKEGKKDRTFEVTQAAVEHLENGEPLRTVDLPDEDWDTFKDVQLLSDKPLITLYNLGDGEWESADFAAYKEIKETGNDAISMAICGVMEVEIATLEPDEQAEFLEGLGLGEPARNEFIRTAYRLLDLISFLTAGPDECRAWPVRRGSSAPKAAGKVHSDIERGFIRAEVYQLDDLLEFGDEAALKAKGRLRVEGKAYIIQDGDVVNYLFNV
jgi:GTP-binding protein YchF